MTCYSNGKFLITGEYLVLRGALSLAVPLKFGQSLQVVPNDDQNQLSWKTFIADKLWFEAVFALPNFSIIRTNDPLRAEYVANLLKSACKLNPEIITKSGGFEATARLNFDINWGLGSSSTLIYNIARWFNIDPFDLHFSVSDGSGYDVACAGADSPILYQLIKGNPISKQINFNPDFSHQLYFVYSGKKQDSAKSIRNHSGALSASDNEIEKITQITKAMIIADSLEEFESLMIEHENIISTVLQLPKAKDVYFSDFEGEVKSLGAWGGDFVLLTWRHESRQLKDYLEQKGFKTLFGFKEIVLQQK
jgi:mevalonate kinase